jgi:hypothetical protein
MFGDTPHEPPPPLFLFSRNGDTPPLFVFLPQRHFGTGLSFWGVSPDPVWGHSLEEDFKAIGNDPEKEGI